MCVLWHPVVAGFVTLAQHMQVKILENHTYMYVYIYI